MLFETKITLSLAPGHAATRKVHAVNPDAFQAVLRPPMLAIQARERRSIDMVDRKSFRRRSRALIGAIAVVSGMVLLPASPATAHVHGITPLRCVGVEDDGANRTDSTPASADSDFEGPIFGLIPNDVGKAELVPFESGGFDTPACPAT
jgi:hypothetical protein